MKHSAMQLGDDAYERVKHDFYVEPSWCSEILADKEGFVGTVYDPACGIGTIPKVFAARGHAVIGSDLVDRGWPGTIVGNFLERVPCLCGDCDGCSEDKSRIINIVCNPPFTYAVEFSEQALKVANGKVAMLVPLTFLAGQKRKAFFEKTRPSIVYALSRRPSMPPGDLLMKGEIKAEGGKRDYCWVVWDRSKRKPKFTRFAWLA